VDKTKVLETRQHLGRVYRRRKNLDNEEVFWTVEVITTKVPTNISGGTNYKLRSLEGADLLKVWK
jgi:hypothetical protein